MSEFSFRDEVATKESAAQLFDRLLYPRGVEAFLGAFRRFRYGA